MLREHLDRLREQSLRPVTLVELALVETLGLALELGAGPGRAKRGSAAAAAAASAAGVRPASRRRGAGATSGPLLLRRRRRCLLVVGRLTMPPKGSWPKVLLCLGYRDRHHADVVDLLCHVRRVLGAGFLCRAVYIVLFTDRTHASVPVFVALC